MNDFSASNSSPLGAIVRLFETELSAFRRVPSADEEQAIRAVYRRFDERFHQRSDYQLWRAAVVPHFAIRRPWLHIAELPPLNDDASLAHLGDSCFEAENPAVLWSAIGVTSTIIRDRRRRGIPIEYHGPIWSFMERLYERLCSKLDPLPDCPASCGIAAVLFIAGFQNLNYNMGFALGQSGCEDFFNLLERWLKVADPQWKPGEKLNLNAIEEERNGHHRLRAGHDAYEYSQLTKMLAILRPVLSMSVSELNPQSEVLLSKSFQYSLTAWLTARSRRIDQILHQHKIGKFDNLRAKKTRRTAFLKELECHWNASNAARDDGQYLEAGKLLYLFYRLIPEEFLEDPLVVEEIDRRSGTIRYLKEVGLEPDSRSASDENDIDIRATIDRVATRRWKLWKAGLGKKPQLEPSPSDEWTGFMLRIGRDQRTDPDWTTLLCAPDIPGGKQTPIGYLLTVIKGLADCAFPASPESLTAAFRLALKYGYVRSAGKILARATHRNEFRVTSELLMDFVHNVKRCTQLDPFGMRHERIAEWQTLIRDTCLKLFEEQGRRRWLSAADRFWLHETVLSRTHAQYRSLTLENKRRLYQKAVGSYKLDNLREFYDLEYNFSRTAPGIANANTISQFCLSYKTSELGAPVAISALRLGNVVSLTGIGHDGIMSVDDVILSDIDISIQRLREDSAHWFTLADIEPEEQIQWPDDFRDICRSIIEVAKCCDSAAKVILLSCDWFLAQFPWQHLFQFDGTNYLIAIVPNFSTIALKHQQEPRSRNLKLLVSTETDKAVIDTAEVVRATVDQLDFTNASVCFVVAHGSKTSESGLPSVRIGPQSGDQLATLDDWMGVLDTRVVILHCCHSGLPTPLVMQELGGLAGLASCMATEALVAPVAEVHPSAAKQLQLSLCSDRGGGELGQKYLRAISSDVECSLYNFFGNPYEKLIPNEPITFRSFVQKRA